MPPHHPLRRISTGSLSSLARSQDRAHNSPSGLDFLQPALTELADEAATLAANIQNLNELHDALGTFNESFAAWLYALKMNAFCVEWPLAPDANSFLRMPSLAPPLTAEPTAPPPEPHLFPASPASRPTDPGDLTYATAYSSTADDLPKKAVAANPAGKRVVSGGTIKKAGTSAAVKKKRELEIAAVIDTLPLEYRGSQPAARMNMEKVIAKLMEAPEGLPIKDIIAVPDLPQPRVNKCLIALVTRKVVNKVNIKGTTWYRWVGV